MYYLQYHLKFIEIHKINKNLNHQIESRREEICLYFILSLM